MSTDTSPVRDADDNNDPDGDPEMKQGAPQADQAEGADDAAETGG